MEFGLTDKLCKKIKLDTLQRPEEQEAAFCWEVNFDIAFRKMIIFIVNASSRFAVIAYGISPGDLRKNLPGIAEGLIRQAMRDCIGIPETAIDAYFDAAGETKLTKTHGKKAVGNMTRLMMDAPCWRVPVFTDIVYQDEMTDLANHEIFKDGPRDRDYRVVMEKMVDDLMRLGIISKEKRNMPRGASYAQLKQEVMKLQMGAEPSEDVAEYLRGGINESRWKHILTEDEAMELHNRLNELR
jgi:hypothetical protein